MTVTVVSGPAGVGKTQWIRQQIRQHRESGMALFYGAPGEGQLPLDRTLLKLEFPELTSFAPDGMAELLDWVAALGRPFRGWIELGMHMDLHSGSALLKALRHYVACPQVALLPESLSDETTPWHQWADAFVWLPTVVTQWQGVQIWRSPLSGQVFDPRSLETLWQELSLGAYGSLARCKGIFELPDGRSFYLDFRSGMPESLFLPVPRELWQHGRPWRFSGIELVGSDLQRQELIQAITDCCLTDEQVAHHQRSFLEPNYPKPL